jgi:hypothetical protein
LFIGIKGHEVVGEGIRSMGTEGKKKRIKGKKKN